MHYMFAYGLNTNLGSMRDRCPDARLIGPAWLDGYGFSWRGLADIDLDPDSYVLGVLWEIGDDDLDAIDHFEGVPRHYTRQRVIISTTDAQHEGWAYIMASKGDARVPTDAYRNAVFEGYRQNGISDRQLSDGLLRLGIDTNGL
jgi:gamma-glutamylcyclotransferase (GGCT)/AIG2-like uncharacterized protein YtfP